MNEETRAEDRPTEETESATEPDAPDIADAQSAEELLEEAERERDQFRNMALRSQADLENYKRRAAQDIARANERILFNIVGIADNLDRALEHPPKDAADADNWLEGVRIAMRGVDAMLAMLASEGVSRIEVAVGDPFDPNLHEAMFTQPTDEVAEGGVAGVFRNGYTLHSRVLRAAQVSVATPATPTTNPEQDQTNPAEIDPDSATGQETN